MSLRLGYSYWGFLGDNKEDDQGQPISTPDGNATYSWSILHEAQRRGWRTVSMQRDRDMWPTIRHRSDNFRAFSQRIRHEAYAKTEKTDGVSYAMPPLDVLLLEWRFPIPGRNTPDMRGKPGYQPDLERQTELIEHYSKTKTKIVIWDLDHKLTFDDEQLFADFGGPDAILETSVNPLEQMWRRTRVEPPIVIDELRQFPTMPSDRLRKLAYIGSRYERDDVIDQYIRPVSDRFPNQIEFWGNWKSEANHAEVLAKWPKISYRDRITVKDFRSVYGTAVACPLLAKRSYLTSGFITPRPWEALMFGCVPVGLREMTGIDQYVFKTAGSAEELGDVVQSLAGYDPAARHSLRMESIEKIRFMDVKDFVDVLEAVYNVG